ncbi:hypothetical protein HETIRDRAFT_450266 [Heterobasidion irregulare TC 32-1]|uniref:Uncharacterized protein n=1 Tax=Heterobasidion irregulare (strain TC 32-1) TaxID=747525 RepID=W4KGJ1_HETIT|nr:uncharacterized protein HETIRDRAFT_450266 [Heterobasidion irregulare TC 32-1]ETW84962.1 hypothetical protein HETIRDRAFT_450266 [Heterobasidion irregulare TC 32-1]
MLSPHPLPSPLLSLFSSTSTTSVSAPSSLNDCSAPTLSHDAWSKATILSRKVEHIEEKNNEQMVIEAEEGRAVRRSRCLCSARPLDATLYFPLSLLDAMQAQHRAFVLSDTLTHNCDLLRHTYHLGYSTPLTLILPLSPSQFSVSRLPPPEPAPWDQGPRVLPAPIIDLTDPDPDTPPHAHAPSYFNTRSTHTASASLLAPNLPRSPPRSPDDPACSSCPALPCPAPPCPALPRPAPPPLPDQTPPPPFVSPLTPLASLDTSPASTHAPVPVTPPCCRSRCLPRPARQIFAYAYTKERDTLKSMLARTGGGASAEPYVSGTGSWTGSGGVNGAAGSVASELQEVVPESELAEI